MTHESRPSGIVYIVDDDRNVRTSLLRFLQANGFEAHAFGDAAELFAQRPLPRPACLVVDVFMPQKDGLSLQGDLVREGDDIPRIFISGEAGVGESIRAFRGGAFDFLEKPVDLDELVASVRRALAFDAHNYERELRREELRTRYGTLTRREGEVFLLASRGLPNKAIAALLGITEKTVKVHRGRAMKKMSAQSLPDAVHMVEDGGLAELGGTAASVPQAPTTPLRSQLQGTATTGVS